MVKKQNIIKRKGVLLCFLLSTWISYSDIIQQHGFTPVICLRECLDAPIDSNFSTNGTAWWLSEFQENQLHLYNVAYMIHTSGKFWGEHVTFGTTVFQRPALRLIRIYCKCYKSVFHAEEGNIMGLVKAHGSAKVTYQSIIVLFGCFKLPKIDLFLG